MSGREGGIDIEGLGIEEDAEDFDLVGGEFRVRLEDEADALVDVEGALEAAAEIDGFVFVVGGFFVFGKDAEVGEFIGIELSLIHI